MRSIAALSESEKRRKELVLYNTNRTLGGDHPKLETRARGPKSGVRAGTHTHEGVGPKLEALLHELGFAAESATSNAAGDFAFMETIVLTGVASCASAPCGPRARVPRLARNA